MPYGRGIQSGSFPLLQRFENVAWTEAGVASDFYEVAPGDLFQVRIAIQITDGDPADSSAPALHIEDESGPVGIPFGLSGPITDADAETGGLQYWIDLAVMGLAVSNQIRVSNTFANFEGPPLMPPATPPNPRFAAVNAIALTSNLWRFRILAQGGNMSGNFYGYALKQTP